MGAVINMEERRKQKSVQRPAYPQHDPEFEMSIYEDLLDTVRVLPKHMIVRLVRHCLSQHVTLADLKV